MDIQNRYCLYVGTVRGVLAHTTCKENAQTHYELETVEKSEITALEWGRTEDEIVVGHKNGITKLFNATQNKYVKTLQSLEGTGAVIGIGNTDDTVIIGKCSGVINIWSKSRMNKFSLNLEGESTLDCMVQNKNKGNVLGTGGENNDLKLWDLETQKCTFKAKSMGHDELNLPIPTSVRGICFLPNEISLVSCATKEGYVLLYDERAQRRPVSKFIEPKASYSTIASSYREKQCVVGTTKGYIQLLDVRSPVKCLKTYKSFTGGVTSLACDATAPIVISTSLDRYLRIHNLDTKELLYKKYMKQSLTRFIVKPLIKEEPEHDSKLVKEKEHDEEYEALFENMETVEEVEKKKKRRSVVKEDSFSSIHKKKRKSISVS